MKPVQMDLIPRERPETALAAIRAAIGGKLWQTPPEIATACGVGLTVVYSWMDEGLIEAVNVSAGSKASNKIFAPSVIKFYERRIGVE